jgi:hypothetical protein
MKKYIGNVTYFLMKNKVFILITALILLAFRAWPRLLYPEVWDEDGTQNIYYFIEHGWRSLFEPVNGYLIIIPKLITAFSISISITQYPLISTVLTWFITVIIFYFIATSPLRLKGGILLAITCLLIPSDPEVFGLPLYTFWWVSLLLFIVVFWDSKSTDWLKRCTFIFFATLSSPIFIITLPLLWIRAWLLRKNPLEIKLALFSTVCAAIQLWVMWNYPKSIASGIGSIDFSTIIQIIPKFLGAYLIGNIQPTLQWFFGVMLLSFFVFTLFRKDNSPVIWGLIYLWCATVFLSISRADINIIHHTLGGPRYFFFPFIIQSWILLQLALMNSNQLIRWAGGGLLILSIMNAIPVLDRKHDDLNWKDHLASCQYFDEYAMPIHYDGNIAHTWFLPIVNTKCAEFIRNDFFQSMNSIESFAYRIIGKSEKSTNSNNLTKINDILKNEWNGSDYYSVAGGFPSLSGYKILGSFHHSGAESGELVIHMHRGQQIWFRSEPRSLKQKIIIDNNRQFFEKLPATSDWVLLEFSNSTLPEEFNVRFVDGGDGWGEWSAIAIAK